MNVWDESFDKSLRGILSAYDLSVIYNVPFPRNPLRRLYGQLRTHYSLNVAMPWKWPLWSTKTNIGNIEMSLAVSVIPGKRAPHLMKEYISTFLICREENDDGTFNCILFASTIDLKDAIAQYYDFKETGTMVFAASKKEIGVINTMMVTLSLAL